jgi:Histidine kinase
VVLACLTLGLTLLMVVMESHKRAHVVLFQVLPAVLITMACSGAVGLWLLGHARLRAWKMLLGPALAGGTGMLCAVTLLAAHGGRTLGDVIARPLVTKGLLASPLLGLMVGLSLFLLARARQRELAAWNLELNSRLDIERLQRERALADLQLLQAQVEPHFLYNTLANLRQLIRLDSERALAMLEHLIRYFKLVLPSFRSERLPLGDEIALVQAYLDLLRERLDRAVRLHVHVRPQWLALPLLPGALLCLVENAVKHGLPEDSAELMLHIDAERVGDLLRLTVRDNGPGLLAPTGAESTGTGLRNLRERLRLSYGERAQVRLQDHGHGCEATLELPWEDDAHPRSPAFAAAPTLPADDQPASMR